MSGLKEKLNESCIGSVIPILAWSQFLYWESITLILLCSATASSKLTPHTEFCQFALDLELYPVLCWLLYPLCLLLNPIQRPICVPASLSSAWNFPRHLEKPSTYLQLYFCSLELFEKFQIDFQPGNAASILIRLKHWKSTAMNHWLSWHCNLFSLALVGWTGFLYLHLLSVPGFCLCE